MTGLRVLDLTQLLPGPYASQLMVEMGAEVIKVEPPGVGDPMRMLPPLGENGESVFFAAVNRGKKSLQLNLKEPAAREALLELAGQVDILLEGFRPAATERLGLGASTVTARHPRLIYASITGYGQTGPDANRAGHDGNYLARSGALAATGTVAGELALPAIQIADLAGGALMALVGILAALYRREQTGEGTVLDIPMVDGLHSLNVTSRSLWQAQGEVPAPGNSVLTGLFPCYRLYPTADRRCLAVCALEPKFWVQFVSALGLNHLAGDPYGSDPETGQIIARRIESEPLAHWAERFASVDACIEPVLDLTEADRFPAGSYPFPFLVDGHRPDSAGPPPALGQDGEQILTAAGFDRERIQAALASPGS